MTNRLWNYLAEELDTPRSYIELETEKGAIEVEPNYSSYSDELHGFIAFHDGQMISSRDESDNRIWNEIEKCLFN